MLKNIGSGVLKVFLFLTVLTGVSLTFVVIYNYLLSSPYMKLEQIEIHGVDEIVKNDLLEMCGLTSEQGLLSLKLEPLKDKIETHPWVRSASVERRLPDTLVIQVEKEDPAALVLMDRLYYMNRWGELFKPVSVTDEVDFPVMTGLSIKDPLLNVKLRQLAEILETLRAQETRWSLQNLSEIHLDEPDDISLYFHHMTAAIRISRQNVAGKMAALEQVAKHLSQSGRIQFVTQIDLNHEDGAIVSFRKNLVSG